MVENTRIGISIDTAQRELKRLLEKLRSGDTMTLTGGNGELMAVLVSLGKNATAVTMSLTEWEARWDALAQGVSRA